MAEITPEYPKSQRYIEMMLVDMLAEKRNWFDVVEIANALYQVRKHAKSMRDEQARHKDNGGNSEKPG